MKDSEVPKLKLPSTCYRPQEYEKWIMSLTTTLKGLHPEIGFYWERVFASVDKTYRVYLQDLSHSRARLLPIEVLARTTIEERIESRLRTMLRNTIPFAVLKQCEDTEGVTCAQMLYRTIVFAGPASGEDVNKMLDILTNFRPVD